MKVERHIIKKKGPAYFNEVLYTGGVEEYYSDALIWRKRFLRSVLVSIRSWQT